MYSVEWKRRLEKYKWLCALLSVARHSYSNNFVCSAFRSAALYSLLLLSNASLNLNTEFESVGKHWDIRIVCYRL